MNRIFLLSILIAVCNAGCGIWTSPTGQRYNLNPLTSVEDYMAVESGTSYTYYYNFCQNINRSTSCLPAPVVQVTPIGSCTPTGLLPGVITDFGQNAGIQIVYTNNDDLCGNPRTIPRVSTFLISCNPAVTYRWNSIEEPGVCQYQFKAESMYACPGGGFENVTDCCTPGSSPGCSEIFMEECVCKSAPECCSARWDENCVSLIEQLGCGECKAGKCCEAHRQKGCEDRHVSVCVCEKNPDCCTKGWTEECVRAVNSLGCGTCVGECCTSNTCNDPAVRDCVCKYDTYCCNVSWDAQCTTEVKKFNCSDCPSLPSHFIPDTRSIEY